MQTPYLLFLGDVAHVASAKTAAGIAQWRRESCVGQLRLPGCVADLDLPDLSPREAAQKGAKTFIVGVVNPGGVIAPNWIPVLLDALHAGLDLAAGLHARLSDIAEIRDTAAKLGRQLFDVRQPTRSFATGTGEKRSGKRLLTVGSDCVVGKKYTALAIERAMRERGMNVDFRATGQTGILITGRGVAVDAVVSDFVAGAAEWLSPDNDPDHWDVIEGQGSLHHPAYAGVTLGLIHGSQPDALVICHEPIRTHLLSVNYPVPPLDECIDSHVKAARLTNKKAVAVGISINTSRMGAAAAAEAAREISDATGLPCCDPIRNGAGAIVDYLRAIKI